MKVAQMLHYSTTFEVLGFAILEDGMQIWKNEGKISKHANIYFDLRSFGVW